MADPFTTPLLTLADMLAASATFQALVGAADATAAALKIHLFELLAADADGLDGRRPFAVLGCGRVSSNLVAGGAQLYLRSQGQLWLYLTDNHDGALEIRTAGLAFAAAAGGILADLAGLSGQDGQLAIEQFETSVAPQIVAPQDRAISAYWECLIEPSWK